MTDHGFPIAKHVGDDMTAIFGTGLRDGPAATGARPATPRSGGRRFGIAALAAGGLFTIVGAGVIAGGSVGGTPVTAPSPPRIAKAPPRVMVAGPETAFPASIASVAPAADGTVAAAVPPATGFVPVGTADRGPAPPPEPLTAGRIAPPPGGRVAAVPMPIIPSPALATPTVTVQAARQAGCDSDEACLDARLDTAERDIADAYAEASDAGVKARILRGYRSEWLRTRDQVAGRPGEALRRYAMMTSDLHNLSEDAAAQDAPTWR